MQPKDANQTHACAATVTRLLNQAKSGDAWAAANLLPLVYERLRELAHQKMRQERPDQTPQARALVHESYIRLVGTAASDAGSSSPRRPRRCAG